ncbi:60S ribosomal protein L12 [Hypoxylon texense]
MPSTTEQRRGPWSRSEDDRLRQLVDLRGPTNWVAIANELGTRSAKQCRERYHQNLKQSLDHTPIRPDEGALINTMVNQIGKRWAEIARHLHNRCDNTVKNWWNGGQNRRIRKDRRRASRQFGRQDETHDAQIQVVSRSYPSSAQHQHQHHNPVYLSGSQGEPSYYYGTADVPRPPSITSPRLYALGHHRATLPSRFFPHPYPQPRLLPGPGLPSPSTASQSSTAAECYWRPPTHPRRSSAPFRYGRSHTLPLSPRSRSSGSSSPIIPPLSQSSLVCDDGIRLPPISCQHNNHQNQSSTAASPRQPPSDASILNPIKSIHVDYEPDMSPLSVTYRDRYPFPFPGSYRRGDGDGGSVYENMSPAYEFRLPTYSSQGATREVSEYTHAPGHASPETGASLCSFQQDTRVPRTITHEAQAAISERPAERARKKMMVDNLLGSQAN